MKGFSIQSFRVATVNLILDPLSGHDNSGRINLLILMAKLDRDKANRLQGDPAVSRGHVPPCHQFAL